MVPISVADLSSECLFVEAENEGLECANIHRLAPLCKANAPGATIRFNFKGTGFGLFGIFGLNSALLKVNIDGKERDKVPMFDQYGNHYRVHYNIIAQDLRDCDHEVTLTIDSEPTDKSVLLPSRPVEDLKQLDGVVWYISKLLLM